MSTFGDIERTFASLYEYRWAIGAATLVFIAAVLAFAYWRGWHRVIWRHRVGFGIASVPMLAITIWLGWSLGSPLFTNVTVEEQFPFALNAEVPPGMEREDVEMVMTGMAMVDDPVMDEAMPEPAAIDAASMLESGEPMVVIGGDDLADMEDKVIIVGEGTAAEIMEGRAIAVGEGAKSEIMEEMEKRGFKPVTPVVKSMSDSSAEVRKLKEGSFKDADAFHKGSGQAIIYTTPDGGHLLRLENLDVTNGPALHVVLSPHDDPTRSEEVKLPGYADLGDLKGNRGNQNYPIPADVDLAGIKSVVIYCYPFAVVFSAATLGTP